MPTSLDLRLMAICDMLHEMISVPANYFSYQNPVTVTSATAGEQDWTCQSIKLLHLHAYM